MPELYGNEVVLGIDKFYGLVSGIIWDVSGLENLEMVKKSMEKIKRHLLIKKAYDVAS